MFYFNIFPQIQYRDSSGTSIDCINITKRYKFIQNVLKNRYILYEYRIKEAERPDIIAEKYYGNADEDYLIFLMNRIIDPYFEWPLEHDEFIAFIKKKYGSVRDAKQTIHSRYRILTPHQVLFDGTIVEERLLEVDEFAYNELPHSDRKLKTFYEWEDEKNEARRIIKLIDNAYMPQIREELKGLYG